MNLIEKEITVQRVYWSDWWGTLVRLPSCRTKLATFNPPSGRRLSIKLRPNCIIWTLRHKHGQSGSLKQVLMWIGILISTKWHYYFASNVSVSQNVNSFFAWFMLRLLVYLFFCLSIPYLSINSVLVPVHSMGLTVYVHLCWIALE